jgi:hypothetical protein
VLLLFKMTSCSSFEKSQSTINQQQDDSFHGDMCMPPSTFFHLLCVLYIWATYQPHGPHLDVVTRIHMSPQFLALHDFSDQGATHSPSKTSIHDVLRCQISWLSFLLDRWFRSNHDLVTQGFEMQRTLPPHS